MSRPNIAAATALLGLFSATMAVTNLHGQPPAQQPSPLTYRRIFVAQQELESQVKGLLPVKREEFERRIAAANKPQEPASALRISRAWYAARLMGQHLAGEARWEIAAPPGASGAVLLEPCNLALGPAQWEETPPRRAVLGIGPQDALTLQVNQAGTVQVPWTRRGTTLQEGITELELELPPAALSELRLPLSERLELTAEPGVVTRGQKSAAGETEWLVELGGMSRVKLRITDKERSQAAANLILIKEQARYALMPTDLAAEFQLQVEVHGEALTAAQLAVDPQMKVTAVTVGGQAAGWSLAGDDQNRTLGIEFPEPRAAGTHNITIQAVSEFTSGRPYRLPRIVWQGAVWQEGSATLSVPSSMQLVVTSTSACRATKGVPPAAGGESLGFQYHAADGYVEIQAGPRQPRLSAGSGVTVQFDATQVTATMRIDLSSQEGEAFEVDAVVSNEWILDSVETVPADLLEDRPVVMQDEQSRTIRLKIQQPITQKRPVRLVVRARLQRLRAELSSDSLRRWFQLKGVIERPAVMALRNNIPNYDLQVAGDVNAVRFDPEASSSEELALLDAPPSGLLFRLPPDASDFQVLLREGEPRYAAAWNVTCECSRSRLRQTAVVRCTPSGPGLPRVMVHSTPPPDREIRWRLTGVSDATIVAQTRRDTSPSPTSPLAGAVWELEFSRPLVQPFGLEATWESPRAPSQSAALFACLDATTQSAVVRITADDDSGWSLTAGGLTALPIPAKDAARFSTTRGLFRYEPGRQASLTITQTREDQRLPLARVRSAELTTRFAADASALNVLSLELENTGLVELPVRLPEEATLQEVTAQGRSVDPLAAGSQTGQFRIPLPAGQRRVPLRITYATAAQSRQLHVQAWRAELPELSIFAPPVTWHVVLPPGVRAVAGDDAVRWDQHLWARFCGPFLDGQPWSRWLHPWRQGAFPTAGAATFMPATNGLAGESPPLALDPGWALAERVEPWSASLSLEVYEPARYALFSLTLALLMAALVLAAARTWQGIWFVAAVGLAAAVLTVPLAAAPLVAGAFWGVVAGGLAALLRPTAGRSSSPSQSRATTTRWLSGASGAAYLLVVALLPGAAERSLAAPLDNGGRNEAPAAVTQRVVIPVDDNRQPAGDYVYVDERLYEWLFGQPVAGQRAEAWQLHSAAYEIRWPDAESGGSPAAEIRASLELESSAADTPVMLPFRREQVLLQPGGVRLDGVPLAAAWCEDGNGLTVLLPMSGKCRLDVSFSAPLKDSGQQRELVLKIPRAARASALVNLPPGAAAPVSATSLGSQVARTSGTDAVWHIDLGATAELALRVGAPSASGQEQQSVEAEQLLWWKVRPGSVVVDAAIKFRPLAGQLRQVQLRFDPHLRLVLSDGWLPPGARHWVDAGATNALNVAFSEPLSGEAVIRPRFLLVEASGVGKIVPPRLEPVASRISRHWVAATAGPGLELVMPQPAPPSVSPAAFVQALGTSGALPQAAFDLAAAPAIAELEFRPEARAPSVTSETTIHCSPRLCRLRFHAELTDVWPHHLQQRIALPPRWIATHVSLRDGDLPIGCRWFQESDGTVVVRQEQVPGSSQQLEVDAVLSPASGAPIVLPAVHLLEVADAGSTLNVVRSQDCAVQVTETAGWTADGEAIDRPQDGLGRLVMSLRGQAGATRRQLTLQIAPNRPQVAARLVTRFARPSSGAAEVVVACELDVSDGKLDALRIETPPDWSGPFETSPPLTVQTVLVPGQARRRLTLIPDVPWTGRTLLVIRPLLRPTAGEELRVPEIELLDVPRVERFVQLPKATEKDQARWQVSGLQSAPLPPELHIGPLSESDYETLAVTSTHFDAVLTAADAPRVEPLVSLLEYRAAWQPSGVLHGDAIFHLDVGGMESCTIAFPPQVRPTFATLDGIPAEVVEDSGGRWSLRLPNDRLPQKLVIGFLGSFQPSHGKVVLTGPVLLGLSAQATIWTLDVPNAWSSADSVLGEDGEVARLDQDLFRMVSAAEILHRAGLRQRTGLSSEALADWLAPWQVETASATGRARAALQALVNVSGRREADFRSLEAQLKGQLQADARPPQPTPAPAASPATDLVPDGSRRLRGALKDQQPQIVIARDEPIAGGRWQRTSAAALLVILGIIGWPLSRSTTVRDWLAASGPFLLAIGSIVLACLSPLGLAALVIMLVALWMSWRPPWLLRSRELRTSVVAITYHSRGTS